MVNALKLASSLRIRKAGFTEVRRKLWGLHFCSLSSYAGSTGGAYLDTAKRYIQTQRSHSPKSAGARPGLSFG